MVGQHGSYKLRDLSGKVLKVPVNATLLKPYHEKVEDGPIETANQG